MSETQSPSEAPADAVNHPAHYNAHPAGIECIHVVELMPFCQGNAVKYLWRAGLKGAALEDLQKARWYVARDSKMDVHFPVADEYDWDLLRKACRGFSALVGSAIWHTAKNEHALALAAIDALITEVCREQR